MRLTITACQARQYVLEPEVELPRRRFECVEHQVLHPGADPLVDLGQHLGQGSRQVDTLEVLERSALHHRGERPPLLALGLAGILRRDEMQEVLVGDRECRRVSASVGERGADLREIVADL